MKPTKPGSKEWKARVANMLVDELNTPPKWHYCSFAADKFLGAVFIKGHGITDISMQTHNLGINPGGELLCLPVPDGALPAKKYRNRLLTKEELEEATGPLQRVNSNMEPQD